VKTNLVLEVVKTEVKREAILSLREILERKIEMGKSTYVAFVDLKKAFDKSTGSCFL